MLRAIEIDAHLRASGVLEVDLNESSKITKRLTKKGFSRLEASLASRLLVCIFQSCSQVNLGIIPQLTYGVSFAKRLLHS